MPKAAREVNFVKTDQGCFNPRRTESLLVVDECTEGVHVTAEAWRVEEAECHARHFGKRPTDGGCAARNACVDSVLEDLEIAGGSGDGAKGVEGIGVAITLEEWDDKTGLPVRRDDGAPQDEVGEREKQVAPPWKVKFESRVGEVVGIWRGLVTLGKVLQRVRCTRRERGICPSRRVKPVTRSGEGWIGRI